MIVSVSASESCADSSYFPKTRMTKLPGTIDGRGRGRSAVGAGGGPHTAHDLDGEPPPVRRRATPLVGAAVDPLGQELGFGDVAAQQVRLRLL